MKTALIALSLVAVTALVLVLTGGDDTNARDCDQLVHGPAAQVIECYRDAGDPLEECPLTTYRPLTLPTADALLLVNKGQARCVFR